MAELVDALVSNTNGFGRAGSTPALGTSKKLRDFLQLFLLNIDGSSSFILSRSIFGKSVFSRILK